VILVDTSVWVDHLYARDPGMLNLLQARQVVTHAFVIGEIAMGHLTDRAIVLYSFAQLRSATRAADDEVLAVVDRHRLHGTGIGFVDAHLLVATMLTSHCSLWTRDKRLRAQAERLGLAAKGLK
jgi:predicted nucleic acid-binding protein